MRLKAVVLPAPFGPINASVSFSRTVKPTSCTACSPPNRLFRFLMTRASAIDLSLRRQGKRFRAAARVDFGQIAHDAGRPPQDRSHQNEGVDGELNAADRIAEPALQQCRRRLQQDGAFVSNCIISGAWPRLGIVVPSAPHAKSRNLRKINISTCAVAMVAMVKYGPRNRKHSQPIGRLASMATNPPATMPIHGEMPKSICRSVDV